MSADDNAMMDRARANATDGVPPEILQLWPQWAVPFLAALEIFGTAVKACEVAKISYPSVFRLKEKADAAGQHFADGLQAARQRHAEILYEAARRRAVEGYDKPVFQRGALVGTIREYSDDLLKLMLTAKHADFKPKQELQHTGKDGAELKIDLSGLTSEQLRALISELED